MYSSQLQETQAAKTAAATARTICMTLAQLYPFEELTWTGTVDGVGLVELPVGETYTGDVVDLGLAFLMGEVMEVVVIVVAEAAVEIIISDDSGGSVKVLVWVMTLWLASTPAGPTQILPISRHPYSPLSPSQQTDVGGQPPAWSGQHVSKGAMQPVPHVFSPKLEHGTGMSLRLRRAGDEVAAVATTAERLGTRSLIIVTVQEVGFWYEVASVREGRVGNQVLFA
jgi:hypothetical protein